MTIGLIPKSLLSICSTVINNFFFKDMHRLWLFFSLIECSSVRFWPEHKSYWCSAQFSRGSLKLPPLHAAAASPAVVCGVHTPWLLHTGRVRLLQLFFLISEFSYTVKSRAEARLDYWHPMLLPYARHYNPRFVYFLPQFSVRFIIKSG